MRILSLIAPLLLRRGAPNPVKALTGYMGALLLIILSVILLICALFTWVTKTYGLEVAFLVTGLVLAVGAIALILMARISQSVARKRAVKRNARIKAMLAAQDDPLSDHIPEEVLTHPISQKILAQVEDTPLMAGATAVGVGVLLSQQLISATD